jgi:hypothetical protein
LRIVSLCAAAAAAGAMGIITVATTAHDVGGQSAVFNAKHGDDAVNSGTSAPVGPAAPKVVPTPFNGGGWLGDQWFNANKAH